MSKQQERLDSLEAPFRAKVIELLERAEEKTGRKWVITAGRRTKAEQDALYALGRTAHGKVVTKAKAGQSAHNYGLAADLAPLKEGSSEIDWDAGRLIWKYMADEAVKLGLTAGYYFRNLFDGPHVEDDSWHERKKLYDAGKLQIK